MTRPPSAYMTAPKVWTNALVDQVDLNAEIADLAAWVVRPPVVSVYRSATLSVATDGAPALGTAGGPSALNAISWDQKVVDTDTFWSSGSNPTRLTVPYQGVYEVQASVTWVANSLGQRAMEVRANISGSITRLAFKVEVAPSGFNSATLDARCVVALSAGDYVLVGQAQSSGSALNLLVGTTSSGWNGATACQVRLLGST